MPIIAINKQAMVSRVITATSLLIWVSFAGIASVMIHRYGAKMIAEKR
ncbi:MAG: hypothetical protein AAF556_00615 [Pseudomonadota bacterium]